MAKMLPSSEQLNEIISLSWELHELTDRSCADVGRALLASRTLKQAGYNGNGRLETAEQADACIGLLKAWIRKKRDGH